MKVPFLDIKLQNAPLRNEIRAAIDTVIDSAAFAGGPFVEAFEKKFASYCEVPFAMGVGNGTDALWLALLALGVGPGDEVITVPNTFMATAEAITYTGARPVFVDVDESNYTMDPVALQRAITPRTKVVIPVHLFGQMADMDPIMEIARAHKLTVIEDAAQAHGATYKGRAAGSIGDAGCFSFYPGKNLGAFGEAGAVITKNTEINNRVRMLRDHGQERKYHHAMVGWNCRMDGIQAAVLDVKLRHLDAGNARRRAFAARYDAAFSRVPGIITPGRPTWNEHVYHVYAIRTSQRDEVIRKLTARGIGSGIHYPVPVHLQAAYAELGYGLGAFPVAERCAQEFISLPMFPELKTEQVDFVTEKLKAILCADNGADHTDAEPMASQAAV
jgi:dTDP-4-amino-4,6-dideoxygalactose transaminase